MSVTQVDRLPARELGAWARFEEDFGPVTLHERIDALIQVQTGEKVRWRKPRPWTDDMIWGWLGAEARKN